MMDTLQIVAGKVYEDRDGLLRYVASVSNARKRVVWRRPSDSPIFSYTDTMSDFVAAIEAARRPSATDTGETP